MSEQQGAIPFPKKYVSVKVPTSTLPRKHQQTTKHPSVAGVQ
jgi:hypothetical protein